MSLHPACAVSRPQVNAFPSLPCTQVQYAALSNQEDTEKSTNYLKQSVFCTCNCAAANRSQLNKLPLWPCTRRSSMLRCPTTRSAARTLWPSRSCCAASSRRRRVRPGQPARVWCVCGGQRAGALQGGEGSTPLGGGGSMMLGCCRCCSEAALRLWPLRSMEVASASMRGCNLVGVHHPPSGSRPCFN